MKPLIHFAHGNGFPALCYSQMLHHLGEHFDYCFIDKIGHDPLYPVADNWHNLVNEILASIKRQAKQPVIAVGHSFGGVLNLLAAIEQPELFKTVIMLDSPLIGSFKSTMVKLAKAVGFIDHITPAFRTKGRRTYWKNYDQLERYLRTRDLFKTFDPACLNDYINHGLEYKADGYHLRFDRRIEYQIYRTIPHIIPQLKGKLLTPTTLIYGDKSKVVTKIDRRYMKANFGIHCTKISGTHLFPMEHPAMAAELIRSAVDAII